MQISETFLKNNMTYLAHFNMVELMDDTIPCLWIWITKRNPWPWVQTWTQEPRSLKHYLWWPTIQCNLSTPASTAKVGRYSTSTQRKSRKLWKGRKWVLYAAKESSSTSLRLCAHILKTFTRRIHGHWGWWLLERVTGRQSFRHALFELANHKHTVLSKTLSRAFWVLPPVYVSV